MVTLHSRILHVVQDKYFVRCFRTLVCVLIWVFKIVWLSWYVPQYYKCSTTNDELIRTPCYNIHPFFQDAIEVVYAEILVRPPVESQRSFSCWDFFFRLPSWVFPASSCSIFRRNILRRKWAAKLQGGWFGVSADLDDCAVRCMEWRYLLDMINNRIGISSNKFRWT